MAASASSSATRVVRTIKASDLASGTVKAVPIDDTADPAKVLLVRTSDGSIHATSHKCPHYLLPLDKAVVSGSCISCPFHGAHFDCRTGDIEDGPSFDKLAVFPASVGDDGFVYVDLPAGTDPVPVGRSPEYCSAPPSSSASAGSGWSSKHFVIVGAGPSSHAAVETLRSSGFDGRITVLAKNTAPYHHFDRTKLSKAMSVAADAGKIALRPEAWWAERGVDLRLGCEVVGIDSRARAVQLASGEKVSYDACLCAPGGEPRTFRADRKEGFSIEGADLGGVFVCREPRDSTAIEEAIAAVGSGCRVAVLGSSFIGMEVAAYLASKHGLGDAGSATLASLTVVGMEEEPFQNILGREFGAAMRRIHERNGVAFELGTTVERFAARSDDTSRLAGLALRGGKTVDADVCVVGAGVMPRVGLFDDAVETLPRGGGVRVGRTLEAAPGLFVCGDVARFPYAQGAGEAIRVEHWDVAIAHGRTAARNMMGKGETFDKVPFFWSGQLGVNIRYAGHSEAFDDVVIQGDVTAPKFTAFYSEKGKITAVGTLQDDPQAVAARDLLQLGRMPTIAQVKARERFDLAAHLREVDSHAKARL